MAATIGSLVRRVRGWAAAKAGGDDRALLNRFIAQRDEAAFDALVRRHGGLVFGLCRRLLPGVHDAEDAFQATFLVLAQKADRIRRDEAPAGWLQRIPVNSIGRRLWRRARNRKRFKRNIARRRGKTLDVLDRASPMRRCHYGPQSAGRAQILGLRLSRDKSK